MNKPLSNVKSLLILSKAILISALERKESRGSHIRVDYPNTSEDYRKASYMSYENGSYTITFKEE